ncbi:MAG: hypothetical protein ACFFD4_20050 [Candidatus Odinarchaeota archaeon]
MDSGDICRVAANDITNYIHYRYMTPSNTCMQHVRSVCNDYLFFYFYTGCTPVFRFTILDGKKRVELQW